jgi:hypothetical protein
MTVYSFYSLRISPVVPTKAEAQAYQSLCCAIDPAFAGATIDVD